MPDVRTAKRAAKPRRKKAKGKQLNKRELQQVRAIARREARAPLELQEHLQRAAATSVSDSGVITDLTNAIAMAGDTLIPVSLMLRYQWGPGDATNVVRTIVFEWLGSAANDPPVVSEILDSLNDATTTAPFAFPNRDYRSKYRILFDKVYAVNTTDNVQEIDFVKLGKGSLPSKMTGVDADDTPDEHKVYALWVSDSAAVTHPAVTYASRMLYYDS